MLRIFFVTGTILFLTETTLQFYIIFSTVSEPVIFITSSVLMFSAFLISNMTSLILVLLDPVPKTGANKIACFLSHVLQLGPLWRIFQMILYGYRVDSLMIKLRFIHCGVQSIPFIIIQGSMYIGRDLFQNGGGLKFMILTVTCLSVAMTYTSHSIKYSSFHLQINSTKIKRFAGAVLVSFGSFLMIAVRLVTIMMMTSVVFLWCLLPTGIHFVLLFFTFMTFTKDITWRVERCTPMNVFRFSILSYFHVFDFMESNLRKMQCKYVAFYAIILVENIAMSAVWLLYSEKDYVTKLITVVFGMVFFVCALISKYSGSCFLVCEGGSAQDDVSVSKTAFYITKGGNSSYRSTDTSGVFKHFPSNMHQMTSAESHTTDTVISRTTSRGTPSRGASRSTSFTQKTDLEYLPDFSRGVIISRHRPSRSNSDSTLKLSQRLRRRLMFEQATSLFHFPISLTLKSSPPPPKTMCVPNINDDDVNGDLFRTHSSKRRRVRGRRGFKLGVPRPYTIHGGITLPESFISNQSRVQKQKRHQKLQRTKSLYIDTSSQTRILQPLDVRRLSRVPVRISNSFSDSVTSYSSRGDDDDYEDDEDTSFPVTSPISSNTKLSFSSSDVNWIQASKPSFVNLDCLPTKTMETNGRIESWLSQTVNIFDLLHEKSHNGTDYSRGQFRDSNYNQHVGGARRSFNNDTCWSARKDRHETATQKNSKSNRHEVKRSNSIQTDKNRVDLSMFSRNIPYFTNAHKNSLNEIVKLKQFIQSTENLSRANEPPSVMSQHSGKPVINFLTDMQLSSNKATIDTNYSTDPITAADNTFQINISVNPRVSAVSTIKQTSSCPLPSDLRDSRIKPISQSRYFTGSTNHRPLVTAESLV